MEDTSLPSASDPVDTLTVPRPHRSLGRLAALRSRVQRLFVVDAAVRVALTLAALVLASFLADFLLELPRAIRALGLVGSATFILVSAVRTLVPAAARSLSDTDLAKLVEESRPELSQILLTSVELTRPGAEGAVLASPALLASVVEEAEARSSDVPLSRVCRTGPLWRRAGLLLALLAALGGGAVAAPGVGALWWQRNVLLSNVRWPKDTRLELWPEAPRAVASGDDLRIRVRVLRGEPRLVTVHRRLDDGTDRATPMERREKASWDVWLDAVSTESVPAVTGLLVARGLGSEDAAGDLARDGGRVLRDVSRSDAEDLVALLRDAGGQARAEGIDVHVHEIRSISDPFAFRIEGGDDELGPFTVDVKLRPRIDMGSIVIRCRYPSYTGQDQELHEQRHGNIKVPVGTRIEYSMQTNVPVRRAFFVLRPESEAGTERARSGVARWPDAGAVELALSEGRAFRGEFVVVESGHYYFQFEDADGFRSERPERFRIQCVPDRKPDVRIVEPDRITEEVSPRARVKVVVSLRDDHGIRRAAIEGAYFGLAEGERVPQSFALAEAGADRPSEARSEQTVEHVIDVSLLATGGASPPVPGARFEFWALAEDFGRGEGTSGQIGESQVYLLEIVDEEQLERLLTDQLMVVRDQLRQIEARQRAVRESLEEVGERVALAGSIGRQEAPELSRHRRDQGRVAESLTRQTAEFDRILARMEANAIGDERWRTWVAGIREDLERSALRPAASVESAIDELRREALETAQEPGRIRTIAARQRRVERELRSLVMRLDEFGDRSALLQLLKDARRRQDEIREKTRGLLDGRSDQESPR